MRRELKKMEKRMDREDERELKQLEGRPKRHILRNVLLIALGTIAAALVAGYFLFDVPSWQRLDIQKITAVQQTGAIYDRNGELVSALKGSEDRTLIALSSLPDHVKNAFIAAEDLRFYRHPGFDVVRIFGAVMANLRSRGFSEGASTITQQLVKLSHLSSEKTIARKLEEIYLALQLEAMYSKDEILQMYLNYVYFGRGAYGVEAAAQAYFDCSAAELTAAQAATLAAIIKAPSAYSPQQNPESNAKRRNYILATMRDNNLLSQEEYALAAAEAIAVIPQKAAETATAGIWTRCWTKPAAYWAYRATRCWAAATASTPCWIRSISRLLTRSTPRASPFRMRPRMVKSLRAPWPASITEAARCCALWAGANTPYSAG